MPAFIHAVVACLPNRHNLNPRDQSFTPNVAKRSERSTNIVMAAQSNSARDPNVKGDTSTARKNKSSRDKKRNSREAARDEDPVAEMTRFDPPPPFSDLGAPPSEARGFYGICDEDKEYVRHFRELDIAFRRPSVVTAEDLEPNPRPLDRDGNPVKYAAAVRYDEDKDEWVPTTEEEEQLLRTPSPIIDPFFIPEAAEGESPTSLRIKIQQSNEPDGASQHGISFSSGNAEFERPHPSTPSEHRRRPLALAPGAWRVVHLGTSSAIPTRKRNVSCTAFIAQPSHGSGEKPEPSMFLVDAGENTDWQLRDCEWCMTHGFRWIRAIFITHLHGDHIYGLPLLLSKIGTYAQFRRRLALESGDTDSEPVIRIYGPYGTRGFVRSSLYWTNPLGVRFSVSELVPREGDFGHIRAWEDTSEGGKIYVAECGSSDVQEGSGVDLNRECAPPHPEEVRVDDVCASEDGLWHVWWQDDEEMRLEVVAAPLRHRLPCFGYVFREPMSEHARSEENDKRGEIDGKQGEQQGLNGTRRNRTAGGNGVNIAQEGLSFDIDMRKARELGVYGSQFRVLRSGRSVTVSKTGLVVQPEDVAIARAASDAAECVRDNGRSGTSQLDNKVCDKKRFTRSATILGDTCDSSEIAEAATNTDLLVHEATFTHALRAKARQSMHSTARMAGEFGKKIGAKKIALTHFSSRYEGLLMSGKEDGNGAVNDGDEDEDEDEDLTNVNFLVAEAQQGYGDGDVVIVAAEDFMEHDILAADEAVGSSASVGGGSGTRGEFVREKEMVSD